MALLSSKITTQIQGATGYTGATGATGALVPWTRITGATGLATGGQYIADTTSAAFSVSLPATASLGSYLVIQDGGNWSVNNLTVTRNGNTIESQAQDIMLDLGGVYVNFIYDGTTWQVSSTIGPVGATGPKANQTLQVTNRATTPVSVTVANGVVPVTNRATTTINVPVS